MLAVAALPASTIAAAGGTAPCVHSPLHHSHSNHARSVASRIAIAGDSFTAHPLTLHAQRRLETSAKHGSPPWYQCKPGGLGARDSGNRDRGLNAACLEAAAWRWRSRRILRWQQPLTEAGPVQRWRGRQASAGLENVRGDIRGMVIGGQLLVHIVSWAYMILLKYDEHQKSMLGWAYAETQKQHKV